MAHTIRAVPVELWDLILHYLDGGSLLTLAVVCREFNKLAIQVYLRKHGISATSIQEGDIDISCDVLLALQLSCPRCPLKASDVPSPAVNFPGNYACCEALSLRHPVCRS
ncbi:hypothetical protein B0H14DRAFT_3860576 [Mycena olivaceomarginata]|nr:hypothetical protein B0H14DRAFT_3860576 [Mycena olivaceomarginata]